jgi:hypothetical protein
MRRPRRHPGRLLSGVLVLAVLGGTLSACTGDDAASAPAPADSARASTDVLRTLQRMLDRRARALRHGDARGFEAGLARRRPAFVRSQRTWFTNMSQLPMARFGYTLDAGTLVREGAGYSVVVERTLQLDGYDDRPVTTPDRFRFTPGRRAGEYLLTSTTDPAWERTHHVQAQPWDTGPVVVREGYGVLGIFDRGSVGSARAVVSSTEDAIGAVAAAVPYSWPHSVVIYAPSDTGFLSTLEDVPGDDPASLDAVAYPVSSEPGGRVAATRVVLNPRMLGRSGVERDRLIRHEVTHVAIGPHDDRAPVWLSEGIAELVSVEPMAPEDRAVPEAAVEQARTGVEDLPDDATFNDSDSGVHYAVAWWACQYVTDAFGDRALWGLLDAMDEPGADPDRILEERLGLSSQDLAEKAGRMIEATFASPQTGSRRQRS